ncbi:MAG: transposase [Opitutaceae bacterium]|nr:transposase [Opitutaceae bacterium]
MPLPAAMLHELRRYWKTHRNGRWVFPAVGRGWREKPACRERLGKIDEPMGQSSVQHCMKIARAAARLPVGMRRYLQHILPPGQHRVRYFGWLHPAAKRRRLLVETLLNARIIVREPVEAAPPWHLRCPHCEQFTLVWVGSLARAPP